MTGLILRLNSQTGEGSLVNAAHEPPFIFRAQDDGSYQVEHLQLTVSRRVGDGIDANLSEAKFSLKPNDTLLLFTDGLFSPINESKKLTERRLIKFLSARAEFTVSAKSFLRSTLEIFNQYREDLPLPDDVSVVSVRRKGPLKNMILENDSGQFKIVSK